MESRLEAGNPASIVPVLSRRYHGLYPQAQRIYRASQYSLETTKVLIVRESLARIFRFTPSSYVPLPPHEIKVRRDFQTGKSESACLAIIVVRQLNSQLSTRCPS